MVFLPSLFFDTECGGDKFFRKSILQQSTQYYVWEERIIQNYRWQNLISLIFSAHSELQKLTSV
jgi:hypothetical protein